jgi:hypothetical protein
LKTATFEEKYTLGELRSSEVAALVDEQAKQTAETTATERTLLSQRVVAQSLANGGDSLVAGLKIDEAIAKVDQFIGWSQLNRMFLAVLDVTEIKAEKQSPGEAAAAESTTSTSSVAPLLQ